MVTNNSINIATGASGTVLQGAGVGTAPTFSTATYPATTTSQEILYSTAANVVGQLTTANSALAATNASGTLAMRLFSVNTQVFTSSGTYTPTTGMLYCVIEVVGGGGGGGGTANGASLSAGGAGGGGGGGYARGKFSSATIGASQTVTIGAAGAAGSAGNNAGGTGGTTSVGALISAAGGVGGGGSSPGSVQSGSGGAGGAGSSGDFQTTGAPGGNGIGLGATASSVAISLALSGIGGSSFFGGGATSVVSGGSAVAGTAATSSGGGGSGAAVGDNASSAAGGAGVKGAVIVTEYIIN